MDANFQHIKLIIRLMMQTAGYPTQPPLPGSKPQSPQQLPPPPPPYPQAGTAIPQQVRQGASIRSPPLVQQFIQAPSAQQQPGWRRQPINISVGPQIIQSSNAEERARNIGMRNLSEGNIVARNGVAVSGTGPAERRTMSPVIQVTSPTHISHSFNAANRISLQEANYTSSHVQSFDKNKVHFFYGAGGQVQQIQPAPVVYNNINHLQNQQNHMIHTTTTTVVRTETTIWEHRFVEIYAKFETFVEKFEIMIEETYIIEEQFDSVNDEEGWNELRSRYAELMSKFSEIREDIIIVLEENKKVIQNLSPETLQEIQNSKEVREGDEEEEEEGTPNEQEQNENVTQDNVWEHRYYELMQQHDAISQENQQIKQEYEEMVANMQREREADYDGEDAGKVAELEKNLNALHSEYMELGENYNKLEEAYSAAVEQLQQQPQDWDQEKAQNIIQQLEEHAISADQKIEELEEELREAKSQKPMPHDQHSNVFQARIEQLLEEKNIFINNIEQLKREVQQYDSELLRCQNITERQAKEIQQMRQHIEQLNSTGDSKLREEYEVVVLTIRDLERSLQEHKKVLEERDRAIEDITRNRNEIALENEEFFNRVQRNEREVMEKIEIIERLQKRVEQYHHESLQKIEKVDSSFLSERVRIEVQAAVGEKMRKIRSLTQDLEQANAQQEKMAKDKEKSIQKIKEFFSEEDERKTRVIQEKENSIRLMQEKLRSLENQLSSRNQEISRFRHQSHTGNSSQDESRKLAEALERKNAEIQKCKRVFEQKCLQLKELEQKMDSLQRDLDNKIFEINNLKRELYEFHSTKSEIETLNSVIKKKNQEINELRLKGIESQQMEITITSLEREKIRINELLKQRSKEIEGKDAVIQSLESKINLLRVEFGSVPTVVKNNSAASNSYDSGLLKQKDSEIRKLKNELEIKEAEKETLQKSIKDKEGKISTQTKTNNVLKAEIENKINRYENEIKSLQKELKDLRNASEDDSLVIDSMKAKIMSLQNSLDERNTIYDQEIGSCKQKLQSAEQTNTSLQIERELSKANLERAEKENRSLVEKIKRLEEKVESKNKFIADLKTTFNQKEIEDSKGFNEKIKQLDGEIKLDSVKMRNMEELINKLSNQLKEVETEKRSYRERLLTETSGDRDFEIRYMSEHYDTMPNMQVLEMERFKIKDPDSNDVFERKVIYDLKRENDMLRKELTGINYSSVSINRLETHQNNMNMYQQNAVSDRRDDDQAEALLYYKNKNKELQDRIDGLLGVNKELKEKIEILSASSNNKSSIEFYKEQVLQLEGEIRQLKSRIKQLMDENENSKEKKSEFDNERTAFKEANGVLEEKISELKQKIISYESTIAQLENSKALLKSEIERLKESLEEERKESDEMRKKDKLVSELKRKNTSLEEQIAKLTNWLSIASAEIERLNEIILNSRSDGQNSQEKNQKEIYALKKRIAELERAAELIREEKSTKHPEFEYNVELIRSLLLEQEALLGQLRLRSESEKKVVGCIRASIGKGLEVLPSFSQRISSS